VTLAQRGARQSCQPAALSAFLMIEWVSANDRLTVGVELIVGLHELRVAL